MLDHPQNLSWVVIQALLTVYTLTAGMAGGAYFLSQGRAGDPKL